MQKSTLTLRRSAQNERAHQTHTNYELQRNTITLKNCIVNFFIVYIYVCVICLTVYAFNTYFFDLDICCIYFFALSYLMATKFSTGDDVWIKGAALEIVGYEQLFILKHGCNGEVLGVLIR